MTPTTTVRAFIQQNLTDTNGPEVIAQLRERWPIFSQWMAEELIRLARKNINKIDWVFFSPDYDPKTNTRVIKKMIQTPESNPILNKIKYMLLVDVSVTDISNILRTKHNISNPLTLINRVKILEDMV